NGKMLENVGQRQIMLSTRLSPDGARVAFMGGKPGSSWDIWTQDLQRGTQTRVTFEQDAVREPAWSPDGKTLVYIAAVGQGGGNSVIRTKAAAGSGDEQTTAAEPHAYHFPAFTPDGKYITFIWGEGNQNAALWAVPLSGERKPYIILQPPSRSSSL